MKNFIDDEKIVDVVVRDKGLGLDSIEIGLDLGIEIWVGIGMEDEF